MKVLITGSKGQLGLELKKQFDFHLENCNIIETDIHNLDISNPKEVFSMLKKEKPDFVVNCAAYTNVDACENNETSAFRVNAIGPQNLSVGSFEIGTKIIQISTDYVFDGKGNLPKREYDSINPKSVYGKSKALGEKLVRETNPRHFIIRTAWLYGEGNNFVRTMLKLSAEKDEISIVDDQFGSPTSTKELAASIIKLMQTENYGTYHGTCEGNCSWYDFAEKIFELKGIKVKLKRITTEQLNRPAERPKNSVLDNYMLKLLGINTFKNWEDALINYLEGDK